MRLLLSLASVLFLCSFVQAQEAKAKPNEAEKYGRGRVVDKETLDARHAHAYKKGAIEKCISG